MEPSATRKLEEITRRLVKEFAPETIVLFGSHAWGHPDEDSDLDLLVVVPVQGWLIKAQHDLATTR